MLHAGERVQLDILFRPSEGKDKVRVLGHDEELNSGVPTLCQIVLVVSGAGEKPIERRKCYQFHPADGSRISLPLDLSSLPYVIEDAEE